MKRRLISFLCVLALCASLTVSGAEAAKPETVHIETWNSFIFLNGKFLLQLYTEEHPFPEWLNYDGNIYIPIVMATALMGNEAEWDEAACTLALSKIGPHHIRLDEAGNYAHEDDTGYYEETTDEEQRMLEDGWRNGVDVELRWDVRVVLDGKEQKLSNPAGERLCPIWFRDEFYLPIRWVSERCGKEISWVPGFPAEFDIRNYHDLDVLYGPFVPGGYKNYIALYDMPTKEQLESVRAYLDECRRLYELERDAAQDFPDTNADLIEDAIEKCITQLELIGDYGDQLRAVEPPDAPFFNRIVVGIRTYGWDLRTLRADQYLEGLRGEGNHLETLSVLRSETFKTTFLQPLQNIRTELMKGEQLLEAVRQVYEAKEGGV